MLGEDSDEVVDVVLLWFRDDDGDLVDTLVDSLAPLAANGVIWLLTPKAGRDGHVEPSDVGEAAPTAGLSQTSSISAGPGLVRHAPGGPQVEPEQALSPAVVSPFGDGPSASSLAIQVGEVAPDFTLVDQRRQPVTLSDFRARRTSSSSSTRGRSRRSAAPSCSPSATRCPRCRTTTWPC